MSGEIMRQANENTELAELDEIDLRAEKPDCKAEEAKSELKQPVFGFVSFLTLKILFFDIVISVGDVGSDFAQGWQLIQSKQVIYGVITMAVNWLPGLVAFIHVISMYRQKMPAKLTITYAILLLTFYPIVPPLAYVIMLWNRPRRGRSGSVAVSRFNSLQLSIRRKKKVSVKAEEGLQRKKASILSFAELGAAEIKFREVEYLAMLSHAIAGGIESPIQFALQMWLICNGKVPKPWAVTGSFKITDWSGNTVELPTTAAFSLFFSLLSMLKAAVEFNIIRVHIENVKDCVKFSQFLVIVSDFMPFFAVSTFFRIASICLFTTYFNTYGFIPVFLFWIANLFIGYRSFPLDKVPLWLISFIALFFPACFTSCTVKNRQEMIKLQSDTFWHQSLSCAIIYIPAFVLCMVVINFYPTWSYDSHVIFNNRDFNTAIPICIFMGIISLLLASNPNIFEACNGVQKFLTDPETNENADEVDNAAIAKKIQKKPVKESSFIKFKRIKIRNAVSIEAHEDDKRTRGLLYLAPQESGVELRPPKRGCISKRQCIRIGIGALITFCLFVPFLLALLLSELNAPHKPLIWRTRNVAQSSQQETVIIQAIPIDGYVKERITGCVFDFASGRRLKSCEGKGSKILKVKRSQWAEVAGNPEVFKENLAIIIVDDNKDCHYGGDSHETIGQYCFRPSFSFRDITTTNNGAQIPLLLVQHVDIGMLFDAKDDNNVELNIDANKDFIEKIDYLCDARNENEDSCLPQKVEGEPSLFIHDKQIRGTQSRHVKCFWGNSSCLGFPNKRETEDFCNGYDVDTSFCQDWSQFAYVCNMKVDNGTDLERKFRLPSRGKYKCEMANLKECASHWSKWTETSFLGLYYRYCFYRRPGTSADFCLVKEESKETWRKEADADCVLRLDI